MPSKSLARALTSASMMFVLGCGGSNEDSAGETCEGPLGKPIEAGELGAMPACCQAEAGKAHCLPNAQVPAELKEFMAACDTGSSCIPDSMLLTGASQPPATCTAFGGDGVCLSRCIPEVAENAALLRPDTCTGADELCVPCISPLDNMPTGACDLLTFATCVGDEAMDVPQGSCDDPKTCNYEPSCPAIVDPTTLQSCGADAHCFDAAKIPDPEDAARLAKCTDPSQLCVPDVFLKTGGKFTPATCGSVNGAEGRCLSLVVPAVANQAELLPQDVCATSERCTPCFDPIDGTATGACNLSCDPGPTQPPKLLAKCCGDRARCVPSTAIPDAQEDNLAKHECTNTELCVPNEILADGPFPACTGNSFLLGDYTGVCLSECLDFGIQGFAIARGSCGSGFKCAPCMQNGQPTGAPGC